jgi:ribosomal protein L2
MILGGEEGVKREELIGREIKVMKIKEVGVGGEVYGVGIKVGERGKIGRAAGVRCVVIKQGEKRTTIRMPSGEVKEVQQENVCTIGRVYSEKRERKGKAGVNRRLG